MFGYEFCGGYWWIFPLVMIFLCLMFMRRCMGGKMCGWSGNPGFEESAMDTLKKRYAKGEIDQSEYEEKKRELNE